MAICLVLIAGYVDGYGLLFLGTSVSFMSVKTVAEPPTAVFAASKAAAEVPGMILPVGAIKAVKKVSLLDATVAAPSNPPIGMDLIPGPCCTAADWRFSFIGSI